MRTFALAVLVALIAPALVFAQDRPPEAAGPFLFLQEENGTIVLASLAERRTTSVGASTTTIAFLRNGGRLLRGDSVTEVDCVRGLRRSGPIFVQWVSDPDAHLAPTSISAGIDWGELGPLDGPLMTFLCENGRHDPAKVSPHASTFVTSLLGP